MNLPKVWMDYASQFDYLERFGRWKWLKTPAAGIGGSEILAMASGIDWGHVFPLIGLALTAIGTAVIGLYRYWRLNQIEIREKERISEMRILAESKRVLPLP